MGVHAVNRYYVTVDLESVGHSGSSGRGWPRSLDPVTHDAIIGRVREFWPLSALIAAPFAGQARANVVAGFDGPMDAMFVLGVVMNAFETAGEKVAFQRISIGKIRHDDPLTVEDLASNN
jgi:hypothetical protein